MLVLTKTWQNTQQVSQGMYPPGQSQQLFKTGARCDPPSGGLAPAAVWSASNDGSVDHLGGQTGARRLRL